MIASISEGAGVTPETKRQKEPPAALLDATKIGRLPSKQRKAYCFLRSRALRSASRRLKAEPTLFTICAIKQSSAQRRQQYGIKLFLIDCPPLLHSTARRDSGAIEQDAGVVGLLYKPKSGSEDDEGRIPTVGRRPSQ
jgi:replicative DNA helicase